jgi:hypothetical protein
MGGKVSIDCEKTGYSAIIDFLTKVCFSISINKEEMFYFNSHFIMEKNIK